MRMLVLPAVLLAALQAVALDAPTAEVVIEKVPGTDSLRAVITWNAVPGANRYSIYGRGHDPYGQGELLARYMAHQFFYIIAEDTVGTPPGFVEVPAGSFTMGSSAIGGESVPEHVVNLTHNYYLGVNEITNLEYMVALQWAYERNLVTVTPDGVEAHYWELLDLDDTDYCEIAFDDSTDQFYLVARTWNSGERGPGFAYPDGYDPANHPVKEVSWFGAACYCDWLSEMSGLPPFYNGYWNQSEGHNPYEAYGYRLPTEAELEYAARFEDGRTFP